MRVILFLFSFFNVKLIILLIVYSLESCAGFDGMRWDMFETMWSLGGGGNDEQGLSNENRVLVKLFGFYGCHMCKQIFY